MWHLSIFFYHELFEYPIIVTANSLAHHYLFDFPMFTFNLLMQIINLIHISTNYAFISNVSHSFYHLFIKNNFVNFNLSKFHMANKFSNNSILEIEQYHLMFQHFENKLCLISFLTKRFSLWILNFKVYLQGTTSLITNIVYSEVTIKEWEFKKHLVL